MSIFDRLFKHRKERTYAPIIAPVSGRMIHASEIWDPVFANEVLGQTIAIVPSSSEVVCPVSGKVVISYSTGHMFGIQDEYGRNYLIHVGIDTITMNGRGFRCLLEEGQFVKAGDPAVNADFNLIRETGLNPIVMLIVADRKERGDVNFSGYGEVVKGQPISD